MESKFNVQAVSEEFKQYSDLFKLFSGVQGEYHGKPVTYPEFFWADQYKYQTHTEG